jgi:hypothetical protein
VTTDQHSHTLADCVETVWSDRMLSAMVIDILSLDLIKHGVQQDTLEDQFVMFAMSGLLDAAKITGLKIDPIWAGNGL